MGVPFALKELQQISPGKIAAAEPCNAAPGGVDGMIFSTPSTRHAASRLCAPLSALRHAGL